MSEKTDKTEIQGRGGAFRVGMCAQGIVLGILLFLALCELYAAVGGIRLFRYQAF